MRTVIEGADGLRAAVGTELGVSEWVEPGAAEVELFEAVAPDPMAPAGTVPPLLVLSLTNLLLPEIVTVEGFASGVNYGTGVVRFGPPAAVGARLRGRAELLAVDEVKGGVQTTMRITVEVDGAEPACTVEALSRWLD